MYSYMLPPNNFTSYTPNRCALHSCILLTRTEAPPHLSQIHDRLEIDQLLFHSYEILHPAYFPITFCLPGMIMSLRYAEPWLEIETYKHVASIHNTVPCGTACRLYHICQL